MITKTEKQVAAFFIILVALAAIAFFVLPDAAYGGKPETTGPPVFVTICHAAGLADEPANWVTLTLPENAVYGQAGHFNENGTTQAGHEQDYLGACTDEEEPPVECPNGDLNGDAEGCDAIVVPPPPPPRVCPDGLPPTPGEGAFDPNDDCKRPPKEEPSTPEEPDHPIIPTCEQVPTICPVTPEAPASPVSPSPSAPEAPAAPSVDQPTLEKELEQQAKKNGATSSPGNLTPATDTLPHTGLGLWLATAFGLLALAGGTFLRGDLTRMARMYGRRFGR